MDLPMPEPTSAGRTLNSFKVLSFDVYGSLIEYKAHILASFQPLISRLPPSSGFLDATPASTTIPNSATIGNIEFLKLFQKEEDTIKLEKPVKQFDEILSEIWRRIAKKLDVHTTEDEAKAFGSRTAIEAWPCFPGTGEALGLLSQHYRLVALSNIDRFAWNITSHTPVSGLSNVDWWKVYTAEDYDSDPTRADDSKLETLVEFCSQHGIPKHEILHVAQSLGHDHAPAKRLGISSVWLIGDGPIWGKRAESEMTLEKRLVGYGWKFHNLRDFAASVESNSKN